MAVTDEGGQVLGGSPPRWPVVGTRLVLLGRVDSPKAIGRAIDLERIAVNHTGRLSEGGRGSEREGSSQGGQFHRFWLARDCGDNAALGGSPIHWMVCPALQLRHDSWPLSDEGNFTTEKSFRLPWLRDDDAPAT